MAPFRRRQTGCEKFRAAANPNPRKVLVVDDDPVIVRSTTMRLETAGHIVRSAADPAEAIQVLGEWRPDVILVDVEFPPDVAQGGVMSWNGFRLITWLRGLDNSAAAQYFIITGNDNAACRTEALRHKVAGFFPKPLKFSEVLPAIEAQLANSKTTPPTE